ncbi:hypothetical protein DH2020_016436 [Rehmannia glutinosa]|uniref:Retrotransposon Copia-like N-terminal domain-containing protein n=1 Tax=Rehmannia glutinosa TaxID=99300 RepID=A0ABR0WMZ2_REHGL
MAGNKGAEGSSTTSQTQVVFPHNQLISVKLDESNFLIWKQQALTTIKGYGLESFITEGTKMPENFTTTEKGEKEVNPNFLQWQRQDQILASWILSSLSESILILTVGLSTSREIWSTLENNFAAQSQAKIMQYKIMLQSLKKNGLSMREYLSKMKACCDVLASAGHIISERDQVLHVLTGLSNEYDSVMVSVTSRLEPCTLAELHALLLSFEAKLESHNAIASTISSEGSQPSVNSATQTTQQKGFILGIPKETGETSEVPSKEEEGSQEVLEGEEVDSVVDSFVKFAMSMVIQQTCVGTEMTLLSLIRISKMPIGIQLLMLLSLEICQVLHQM